MKLKVHYCVPATELQTYLDKYGNKIKFILPCTYLSNAGTLLLVIDED